MINIFKVRTGRKLRLQLFSNDWRILGALVFIFSVFFTLEANAVVQCGTMSCPPEHYCHVQSNFITQEKTYSCRPQGNQSVNPCAGCPDGTSCKPNSVGSMTCVPDQVSCTGPCPYGSSQVLRNGRCECPSSPAQPQANSHNQNEENANEEPRNNNNAACISTLTQLQNKCAQEIESTAQTCDDKRDPGLNNVSNQAAQMTLALGQQTSGSVHAACSKMAQFSQAANAALAAFRLNCSSSISSCTSACDQTLRFLEENNGCEGAYASSPQTIIDLPGISEATRRISAALAQSAIYNEARNKRLSCNSFDAKINEANQAISNYAATGANSSQCANLSDGTGAPPADFCKENPKEPSCLKADCTNPAVAATNIICICTSTPEDPRCDNRNQRFSSPGNSELQAQYGSTTDRAASSNSADFGGDVPFTPEIPMGEASRTADTSLDGSQGSSPVSAMSGGGSGGGNAGGEGGDSSSNLSTDINGGAYGGSRGGTAGSSSSGGYRNSARGLSATGAKPLGSPDLRQFLPGGMQDPKSRKLAGDSSPHGISGPHSNIWKNIQNRYRIISPTLMP